MAASPIAPDFFDDLARTLDQRGPEPAIEQLIDQLRGLGQLDALFYALLLHARWRMGIDPVPTRPAAEIPESRHGEYEDAIRMASRSVGQLYLERGEIVSAWNYYRLIGEPQPIRDAIERLPIDPESANYALIEIAFHQGVHPQRGFEMVLQGQGICNAITLFGGFEGGLAAEDRVYCVRRLVEVMHAQLLERMRAAIEEREGQSPEAGASLGELMANRDWLFGDDWYLVDLSHLGSVVQSTPHLGAGDPVLPRAIALCEYGSRLPLSQQCPGDPPFEQPYRDHGLHLQVLAGQDAGLEHFRAHAFQGRESGATFPAEVYINLLLALGREAEAARAARELLVEAHDRQLRCPGPYELTQRVGDHRGLAELARARGDGVHFLAGLLLGHSPRDPR